MYYILSRLHYIIDIITAKENLPPYKESKCAKFKSSDNWFYNTSHSHLPCAYEIPSLGGKEAIVFISWKLTKNIQWKSSQQVVAPVLCSPQRQDTYCQSDDKACTFVHSIAC